MAKGLGWPGGWYWQKAASFDFVEMSGWSEADERLSRLEWTSAQRASLVTRCWKTASPSHPCACRPSSIPFVAATSSTRQAREISGKAIRLARDLGIHTIQLAGYDVYYEEHDEGAAAFAKGWPGRWNKPQRLK